jgi:hypothetical protein
MLVAPFHRRNGGGRPPFHNEQNDAFVHVAQIFACVEIASNTLSARLFDKAGIAPNKICDLLPLGAISGSAMYANCRIENGI